MDIAATQGRSKREPVQRGAGTALDLKPVLRCWRGATGPVARIKGFDSALRALFEFAARRVEAGLPTSTLCLCYGGELEDRHVSSTRR